MQSLYGLPNAVYKQTVYELVIRSKGIQYIAVRDRNYIWIDAVPDGKVVDSLFMDCLMRCIKAPYSVCSSNLTKW